MSTCPSSTQAHEVVLPHPHVLPISLGAYLCYPHVLPPTSRLFTPILKGVANVLVLTSARRASWHLPPWTLSDPKPLSSQPFCISREPHSSWMTPSHFLITLCAPPPGITLFALKSLKSLRVTSEPSCSSCAPSCHSSS